MLDDFEKQLALLRARHKREARPPTLKQIRDRHAAAAPGPWTRCMADGDGCSCGLIFSLPQDTSILVVKSGNEEGTVYKKEDVRATAAFVAHSISDVAWLLKRVETLEARLKENPGKSPRRGRR